jgi:hypothetical protein
MIRTGIDGRGGRAGSSAPGRPAARAPENAQVGRGAIDGPNICGPLAARRAEGHGSVKAAEAERPRGLLGAPHGAVGRARGYDKAARLTIGEPGRLMIRWAILGSNQ